MFKAQKDSLFTLVKSLNKAEKRNFKLYVNRLQNGGHRKFIQLFEALDKLGSYDEEAVLKKTGIEKKHLANLKRNLYKQILTSLRLIHINKNVDIQIREQVDFARILYGKGMYMQSLRILERIKKIALEHHQDILHLEILEFQKMIETRHVTRNRNAGKIEELLHLAERRSFVSHKTSQFSNLNIQIHGWYIQHGHATTAEKRKEILDYYDQHRPDRPVDRMTFHEIINFHQANMWLHYILLDFERSKEAALNWLNEFEKDKALMEKDPDLYMRGLYYLLTLLFFEENKEDYDYYLRRFEFYIEMKEEDFNENSQMIAFVYLYLARLNAYLVQKEYHQGLELQPEIQEKILEYKSLLEPNRILLFNYKIAYCEFGIKDFDACLGTLNEVVHHSDNILGSDLNYSARLLRILCHYELGNYTLVDTLVTSAKRSFSQKERVTQLQLKTLHLLGVLARKPKIEHQDMIAEFLLTNELLFSDPKEQRNLRFLDAKEWLEDKVTKSPITIEQTIVAQGAGS